MFGVSIRPPHGSIAENPTSSRTMYSRFGEPSGATGCKYGAQSGTESRVSTLMIPLKRFAIPSSSRGYSSKGCGVEVAPHITRTVGSGRDDPVVERVGRLARHHRRGGSE